MQKLLDQAEASPSAAKLSVSTHSTLKTLEDYNRRATRYVRMQGAELQHMLTMLTRAVTELESGSHKAAERLRDIETKLETVLVTDDARALKLCAVECLIGIRQEAEAQKMESGRMTGAQATPSGNPGARSRWRRGAGSGSFDWAAGTLCRGRSTGRSGPDRRPGYTALFIVDGVALINSQLGYAAGDRRLPIADQLFRLSGPAFLALLNRTGLDQ